MNHPLSDKDRRYRRYVLFLLTLVYALNFVDRQILVILSESIKLDMDLSDSQLGLLTGFAFAIFYVSVGIPIARWADRGNRRNIVALAVATWSGMTALSGLTQNFWQLLMARIGVGVGEAGGSPPAHSIISDYYPVKERGRAMSIYSTGVYIGVLLGFLVGGWINHTYGWRVAFFAVGLPGFIVALLVRYTLKEPKRGQIDGQQDQAPSSLRHTLQTMWQMKSFRWFTVGAGLTAFTSYGIGNFTPSFLIRSHGFDSMQVGIALAVCAGLGGAIGTFLGGLFADKLGQKDMRWYLWIAAIPCMLAVPFTVSAMVVDSSQLVLVALFLSTMLGAFYLGPTIAITHTLVSPGMRAMASAVLFFVLNLIGLGLGPLSVGMLSDALAPSLGADSLRYAMGILAFMGLFAAMCYAMGARHLLHDLAKRNQLEDNSKADDSDDAMVTT